MRPTRDRVSLYDRAYAWSDTLTPFEGDTLRRRKRAADRWTLFVTVPDAVVLLDIATHGLSGGRGALLVWLVLITVPVLFYRWILAVRLYWKHGER